VVRGCTEGAEAEAIEARLMAGRAAPYAFPGEQAAALVRDAWSANEHVPAILAGTKLAVNSNEAYITMGGPDEATYYVTECGAAWHRTPGAVAWLTTLGPKRRTRATTH
jgi:hypothetical protein